MTLKTKSFVLWSSVFLIAGLLVIASRCQAQHLERLTWQGSVSFKRGWIFIQDKLDSVRFDLEVLAVDTSGAKTLVKVLSVDGIGFVSITEHELIYHYKVLEGNKPRSRSRIYIFKE